MEKSFPFALTFALIFFFSATLVLEKNLRDHPPTDQFLVPPPEYIEYFAFGFGESIADSIWLRWIQDSDNCQTYLKPVENLTVEPKPVEEKAHTYYDPRHKVCDNSWAFKMLDAVTKLAPRFKMPYVAGGISLSVLTEDYAGANVIFDRGIAAYPDDWNLAYRAAYHYLFDMKDKARAAELLNLASDHGAPYWVKSLAARLFSESGQLELGLRTLIAYRDSLVGDKGRKEIEERITALKRRLEMQPPESK